MHTSRQSASLVTLICLMVFAGAFVIYTTAYLPETVATHFGVDNRADGWMSRNGYLLFTLGFLLAIPPLLVFCIGKLPRRFSKWTSIPSRDHWLVPERREESLRFLLVHGRWLGCLIVVLITGLHITILVANRNPPPTLPLSLFLPVVSGFFLALLIWILILRRRFRKEV